MRTSRCPCVTSSGPSTPNRTPSTGVTISAAAATLGEVTMHRLRINGEVRDVEADPDTPLLWVLRDHLGLTGTKYGCGVGACGVCTSIVDGQAFRPCQHSVASMTEQDVRT